MTPVRVTFDPVAVGALAIHWNAPLDTLHWSIR
jgi:hypothetical protein